MKKLNQKIIYTSVLDAGIMLIKVYHQKESSSYYNQMLELLKHNKNHSKLPNDIPSDITVYNKTGEYEDFGVQNDSCIFETSNSSYIVVVLSQDGDATEQVNAMIQFGSDLYSLLGGN